MFPIVCVETPLTIALFPLPDSGTDLPTKDSTRSAGNNQLVALMRPHSAGPCEDPNCSDCGVVVPPPTMAVFPSASLRLCSADSFLDMCSPSQVLQLHISARTSSISVVRWPETAIWETDLSGGCVEKV